MSDWKIEAVKADRETIRTHDLLVSFLVCQRAWRRLSKPARAALEAAYPDGVVEAHPNTKRALWRHGFIQGGNWQEACTLTDAAKAVVKWCVKP